MATKRRSRSLSTSGDTDSSRENSANVRAPSSALAITTVPHRSPITSDAPGNVDSGSAGSTPRLRRGCSRGSDPANEGTSCSVTVSRAVTSAPHPPQTSATGHGCSPCHSSGSGTSRGTQLRSHHQIATSSDHRSSPRGVSRYSERVRPPSR